MLVLNLLFSLSKIVEILRISRNIYYCEGMDEARTIDRGQGVNTTSCEFVNIIVE